MGVASYKCLYPHIQCSYICQSMIMMPQSMIMMPQSMIVMLVNDGDALSMIMMLCQ